MVVPLLAPKVLLLRKDLWIVDSGTWKNNRAVER